VKERHLEAEQAGPGLAVDKRHSFAREPRKLRANVGNFEGDVMHAGTALAEKLADRSVRAECAEELDPALADPKGRGLDSLVGNDFAVLELGAEQMPVRLDRLVEIGDGDSDVVNAGHGGDGTCAKIDEMKRWLAASLLVVALLAGCGSGTKSNGEASKPGADVVTDAIAAANGATSVHVKGSGTSSGQPLLIDLYLVAGKGGKGRLTISGLTFDIVRIGDTAYFKGDKAFWKNFGGSAMAALIQGRWLKESAVKGQLSSFTPLTDIKRLFNAILASHGNLKNKGEITRNGARVVELDDTTKGGSLFVAATGSPYPLSIAKKGEGEITFTAWNEPVTMTAPAKSIDASKLGAG
jgi:hypothetical protein